MKKYCISTFILFLVITSSHFVSAQSQQLPYFLKNGTVTLQTQALNASADTIATVFHRSDDIIWSRIVYRIIDMRDKQNYQLYFPTQPSKLYRSLFRVILDAVVNDTLKGRDMAERDIIPDYYAVLNRDSLANRFISITNDTAARKILNRDHLIKKDPTTNKYVINKFVYPDYVKDQLKFIIQEVVFFDKHMSRLYSQIIAVAPFYSQTETNISFMNQGVKTDAWQFLQSGVLCWFLYNDLRPYLIKQYVIPNKNDDERLTYDDFFTQHLYSSYILGVQNDRGWMIPRYETNPEKVRAEQQKIEDELLNFEEDLWEY